MTLKKKIPRKVLPKTPDDKDQDQKFERYELQKVQEIFDIGIDIADRVWDFVDCFRK